MRIVILGAGQVGSSVAENLVSEANDITVVDTDAGRLKRCRTALICAPSPATPRTRQCWNRPAPATPTCCLAVTQSDETNMVACKLAATMFNIPTKIARIRSADYLSHPEIFSPAEFSVDSHLPEQVLTDYIAKLLEFPKRSRSSSSPKAA
jgi:trk system potassium uptake protein TrkA